MKHFIVSLREKWDDNKKKYVKVDSQHSGLWTFDSLPEMLNNHEKFIAQIPEKERWNLFYTVAQCAQKQRNFAQQTELIFDIDKMGQLDENNFHLYLEVVSEVLRITPNDITLICSGNGLHFVLSMREAITETVFFDANRKYYKAICEQITARLGARGLPGHTDTAVFDAARIMRLPGTENRKDGRPSTQCRIIQCSASIVDINLKSLSGVPDVAANDQVVVNHEIPTDGPAVLAGCDFLNWSKTHPNDVSEPQWYAALSILARIDRQVAHEYSSGHKSYSFAETETKIDQALEASGPRTCANINTLWNGCKECASYKKCISPIMIRSADFIETEKTGFHWPIETKTGKKYIPDHEGLAKAFKRDFHYRTINPSTSCMIYADNYWQEWSTAQLENYAHQKFTPKPHTKNTTEFANWVSRTELTEENWFTKANDKKTNFKNGVLDLKTGELLPHDPGFGFRYILNYDYDPAATCPEFDKFLCTVMADRQELAQIFMEYVGYCLSGDSCWAQKAMLLVGEGSNGKSTALEILRALAGEQNVSSVVMKRLDDPTHRYLLVGKLFNIDEETSVDSFKDTAPFKSIVTGGVNTVKQLYKQPMNISLSAKLIFACNELPRSADTSDGFFRRCAIIPFDKKFKGLNKDPFIKEKLLGELPGIFNLALAAYRNLLQRKHFIDSKAANAELEQFKMDTDTVKRWLRDNTMLDDSGFVQIQTLYSDYRIYCETQGDRAQNMPTFCRRLSRLLPENKTKLSLEGEKLRGYTGLRLIGETAKF